MRKPSRRKTPTKWADGSKLATSSEIKNSRRPRPRPYWFVCSTRGEDYSRDQPSQSRTAGQVLRFFANTSMVKAGNLPPMPQHRRRSRPRIARSIPQSPTNRPAVAFSVPVFRDDSRQEVLGILAMEAELGHFSDSPDRAINSPYWWTSVPIKPALRAWSSSTLILTSNSRGVAP